MVAVFFLLVGLVVVVGVFAAATAVEYVLAKCFTRTHDDNKRS